MPRLYFIHHGLRDLHSHYYGEAKAWMAACRSRGIDHRFYIHRAAAPAIVAEFAARPVFPFAPDSVVEPDESCRALADFLNLGSAFAAACAALDSDGVKSDDIVVVTLTTERDLYGAALWLERRAAGERPTMVFIFHIPAFDWRTDESGALLGGAYSFHRYAMKRVLGVLPARKLAILATNRRLARALSIALDHPCDVAPLAIRYPDEALLNDAAAQRLPRAHVRFAGEFRSEKGSDILAGIIARFAAARPGRTFGVQLPSRGAVDRFAADVSGVAATLHLNYGDFAQDEFYQRLARSDIVLLPYRWQRYAMRASGVFCEAVGLGRVTVVPRATWMGDMLAEGWGAGLCFDAFSADAIARALVEASDAYPVLSLAARSRSHDWRRAQSVDALLEQVLARR